jgi:hypothetical protein
MLSLICLWQIERFSYPVRTLPAGVNYLERIAMSKWELKEDKDISWWHCDRAGYWEGDEVYCSKCQNKMEQVA